MFRRKMFYQGQLIYGISIIFGTLLTYVIFCWLFTYLDPQLTHTSLQIYTPYQNSEKLIQSLKSVVYVGNDTEDFALVKNLNDLEIRNEGYSRYGFNALSSRNIGIFREIPDTRHQLCKNISYPEEALTTSIIICFYNEHFETLLRTLHSIVRSTPKQSLKEIILIDDFSDIASLNEDIKRYITLTEDFRFLVHFHKTKKREGLIRARIFGSNLAKGEILVFLDSHIEVNKVWLEPLLSRISENRTSRVVMPIIDIINPDTLQYTSSPLVRGGFNWGLHFKWENLPKGMVKTDKDFVKPIKSPTMAGGLFAIDKNYFNYLGQYDSQMDIWGGENLELSFRVWMCGGTLEIIPCSRVGHIFRRHRPYTAPDGQDSMIKNSLRVAHVWLDQYKEHYFAAIPETKYVNFGNVSERLMLRKRLKCQSFDWYLKNVYPELVLPNDDQEKLKKKSNLFEKPVYQRWDERKRNYVNHFVIRLSDTNLCITSENDVKSRGSPLILKPCLRTKNQVWYKTDRNELVLAQLLCLDISAASDKPKLSKCHELGDSQEWKHSYDKNTAVYNMAAGTCLGVFSPTVNSYVIMKLCTSTDNTRWNLVSGISNT